jgi:hypothetical protein
MFYDDLDEIAEALDELWRRRLRADGYAPVVTVWERVILPALEAKAKQIPCSEAEFQGRCARAMRLALDLFKALHDNVHSRGAADAKKPRFYWLHHPFDVLKANDARRGFVINKEALLCVAAEYLSHPEIRCDHFDWLLLDSIVFAELDGSWCHLFNDRAGADESHPRAEYADWNPLRYLARSILFRSIGIGMFCVVPPALSILTIGEGQTILSWSITGLWGGGVLSALVSFIGRWKAREKAINRLTQLRNLYQIIGSSIISPRLLKEALDNALATGVALDGAVASIVDRMIARDATTFVPGRRGW